MVVVGRFTASPYLPKRSFGLLYQDVTTLSGGTSSTQFPLDLPCLCRLHSYSTTKVVLPQEEGEEGVEGVSLLPRDPVGQLWGRALHVCPYTAISSLFAPIPVEKRAPQQRKDPILLPSLTAVARLQPGKSPAGMGVSPQSTGVG